MPKKIRDTAELVFIQTVASGTVHIEVRYVSWDSPHEPQRVSFADGLMALFTEATIVLCGARTFPVPENTHYYTDCFFDEQLCQRCHASLHPDDVERAFRHRQPDDEDQDALQAHEGIAGDQGR